MGQFELFLIMILSVYDMHWLFLLTKEFSFFYRLYVGINSILLSSYPGNTLKSRLAMSS